MNNATRMMLIVGICCLLICLAMIAVSINAHAEDYHDDGGPIWTNRMIRLHEMADELRSLGYSDDSPVIQALSNAWWEDYHDLCIVAKVVDNEANDICEMDHKVYVGAVVMNRVKSDLFPNSVHDVVAAPGQYSHEYLNGFNNISRKSWIAARMAIDGEHDAPSDLYWQAEFPQGREIWKTFVVDTPYFHSTTYFCRGTVYDKF